MSELTLRATCKDRLVSCMAAVVPTGVEAFYAYSQREIDVKRFVVLTDTTGSERVANQRAGRKRRRDEFTQTVWVADHLPVGTAYEAELAIETIFGPIERGLADPAVIGPVLQGASAWASIVGLVSATVQDVHGPNAVWLDLGWGAEMRFTVAFLTDLD